MLRYYDADSLDRSGMPTLIVLHAPPVNLVSKTTSRRCFPHNSRIKIKPELHFILHPASCRFRASSKDWVLGLDWVPQFIFTVAEVGLAASILSDSHMVLGKVRSR
jgi:hypothetical protein